MARLLLASRATLTAEPVVLVPVPSQPQTVRDRGYDSVALLARAAGRTLAAAGLTVTVRSALRHVRRVRDQSTLLTDERLANLRGALVAVPTPGLVVVVDDVVTTGATVHEAVRALRESGCQVVGAACVAGTVLRRPPDPTPPLVPPHPDDTPQS